jgi:creatinine amidohydrolase
MVNWENTFHEIQQAKPEIALLPIGSIEQHSYHLPVATDYLAAQALAERVARELDSCYLLPALPFSCSREHLDFFGTVWLRPATLAAVVEDLVGALHHHGIRKVAVLVAHGGNWIVKPTIREINLDRKGVHVIFTTAGAFTAEQGQFQELHLPGPLSATGAGEAG